MAKLYYVGKDMNANDLTHWKYIKREKVNGKWRYYYKDDATGRDTYAKKPDLKTRVTAAVQDKLGYDEREAAKNAKANKETARQNLNTLSRMYEDEMALQKKYSAAEKAALSKDPAYQKTMSKLKTEISTASGNYSKANQKAEAAVAKYAKTPLGKIENLAAKVEKSKAAIKNAANKTLSQIKQSAKTNEKVAKFLNVVGALNQASKLGKHVAKYDTTWKVPIGSGLNIVTKTRHDRKKNTKYSVSRIQ